MPGDDFLVVASDGLWDVMSSTAAVGLVHDTVKEPSMCAQRCALFLLLPSRLCSAAMGLPASVCWLLGRNEALQSVLASPVRPTGHSVQQSKVGAEEVACILGGTCILGPMI